MSPFPAPRPHTPFFMRFPSCRAVKQRRSDVGNAGSRLFFVHQTQLDDGMKGRRGGKKSPPAPPRGQHQKTFFFSGLLFFLFSAPTKGTFFARTSPLSAGGLSGVSLKGSNFQTEFLEIPWDTLSPSEEAARERIQCTF